MTVAVQGNPQHYVGTGANTALNTVFKFFAAADVIVIQRITLTGVPFVLTKDVHYTLTGGSEAGAVGVVTPIDGATDFTILMTWTIQRLLDITQPVPFMQNGSFPSVSHEAQADRRVLISQDNASELDRAIRIPVHDAAATITLLPDSVTRANKAMLFDGNGNVTVGTQTTVGYGKVLLDSDTQTGGSELSVSFTDWPALFDRVVLELIDIRPGSAGGQLTIEPLDGGAAVSTNLVSSGYGTNSGVSYDDHDASNWKTPATTTLGNAVGDHFCGTIVWTAHSGGRISGLGNANWKSGGAYRTASMTFWRDAVAATSYDGFEVSAVSNTTGTLRLWGEPKA